MSHTQKAAIVTGGSKGIGRAIAAALLESGAHVLITGRDAAALAASADALGEHGRPAGARVEWLAGDVRREGDARAMVDEAARRFGGLDILVNNAAVGILVETADMTGDQWRETHRDQPERRILLHPRRDSAPALPRRRLDHQYQQPGQPQPVPPGRRLFSHEGRAQCLRRRADAGTSL